MAERQKTTARKRRRNQNTEIEELSSLLPLPVVNTGKPGIDKISVLRLATTYIRFQDFLDSGTVVCSCDRKRCQQTIFLYTYLGANSFHARDIDYKAVQPLAMKPI